MTWLKRIKYYFYRKELERGIQLNKTRRSTATFEQCNKIGILFAANDEANRTAILQYAEKLQKKGKSVSLLAFFDNKEKELKAGYPHFNHRQIGFNHIPKSTIIQEFTQQSFDLLITYFLEENLALEYITSCSKARCRIGNLQDKLHCFDLIINTPKQKQDFAFYTHQIEQILSKMNQKVYEPTV